MSRAPVTSVAVFGIPRPLDPNRPKGDQIREKLEDLASNMAPGSPVPSDRQLAEYFGVARMTVRREISALVSDGVLESRRGSGTFVAADPPVPHTWGASYSLHAQAREMRPGMQLLERSVGPLSARRAAELEVPRDSPGLRLVRLRTLESQPMGVESVYLPLERFPGLEQADFQEGSLYSMLEQQWGLRRVESAGVASAVLPTDEQASLLQITSDQPCMVVRMLSRDEEGVPFEVGRSIYRGDRYELAVTHRAPLSSGT